MITEPITNSLKGCNAIITAGGSGLGKGIAQKLASQGAMVFVWDKDKKSLLDNVKLISYVSPTVKIF